MIVISGVLVLVALVLLVIGVVGPDLTFVYASIGVSLVSLVFLVIGILQRRGETPPGDAEPAAGPEVTSQTADDVTAVVPSPRAGGRRSAEEAPVAETAGAATALSGDVLVVEGRPRYHVGGCRYLSGKDAELVEVGQALEEGFSPCGVCKPDDALAGPVEQAQEQAQEQPQDDEVEVEAPTAPAAAVRPAKKAGTRVVKAPAKKAATSALGAAPATKAPARSGAAKAAAKRVPSRAATAAAASTPAAATAAGKAGSVVVIPDRGKFHRADCRYVRDVDGTEVLSKTAATRQGYAACGVCKP